jgi:hypothetical protein
VTVSRAPGPSQRGVGCDTSDRGRVDRGGTPRCGRLRGGLGRLDPPRAAPAGATLDDCSARAPAHPGRSALVPAGLPAAASHATAPRPRVREAPLPSDAGASWLTARGTPHPAGRGGCARSSGGGLGRTPGGGRTPPGRRARTRRRGPTPLPPGAPLVVRRAPRDPSRAPTTHRHRMRVIAARTSGPGATRACGARPPGVCGVGVRPLRGGGLTSASPP